MEAAKALGREVVVHPIRQNIDIEKAFASFAEREVSGITVAPEATSGVDETGAKPAGIQAGDVIMRMDGKEILELRDLPRIIAGTPANKSVEIVIIRAGVEKRINVTLGPGIPLRTR